MSYFFVAGGFISAVIVSLSEAIQWPWNAAKGRWIASLRSQ